MHCFTSLVLVQRKVSVIRVNVCVHLLFLHQSTRGSSTVKHYIKHNLHLAPFLLKFSFHPDFLTQIYQFGKRTKSKSPLLFALVGCKDSQ